MLGAVILGAVVAVGPGAGAEPVVVLEVVNEAGAPVPNAEAYLIEGGNDLPATARWVAGTNGTVTIEADDLGKYVDGELEGMARAVVRAPGHAWAMVPLDTPSGTPVRVTLTEGREVELVIEGAPAEVSPIVFTRGQSVAAWLSGVQSRQSRLEDAATAFSATTARLLEPGRYRMRVPADLEELWVLVDQPGFLRAFQAGPLRVEDVMTVGLVEPATITIDVSPLEGAAHEYEDCGARLMFSPPIPDGGWSFEVASRFVEGRSMAWRLEDLAPGGYSMSAYTGTSETWKDRERADFFEARAWVEVSAGSEASARLELQTYDESLVRERIAEAPGATLEILGSGGRAPEGAAYEVSLRVRGFDRELALAEGEVPADGRVEIDHLPGFDVGSVSLMIDNAWAGSVEPAEGGVVTMRLAPVVGEPAPDFEMVDILTGQTVRVSDYRGRVLLLEFWASWCGPCQAPMAHNDELMASKGDAWEGRAAIVGVSIDNEIETIREHVERHGWTHVRQVWCEGAWKSEGAERYAVRAVPSAFLIDREGVVAWAGHPGALDVAERIGKMVE